MGNVLLCYGANGLMINLIKITFLILAIDLILLLAACSVVTAQTPTGMMRWQIDDTTHTFRVGGAYQNYEDSTGWHAIENDFHVNGDRIMVSWNRLLKTSVDSLGDVIVTFTYNETDYTVIQQPHSLKWFRKSDSVWINIDNSPNFNNLSLDSNIISWRNMYPGVDYSVVLNKSRVENRYEFKPVFLDSMVILLDQRSDSADIYLANVMKFTLTTTIDDDTVSLGAVRKRVLKRFGGMVFQVGKTRLQGFPGADTLEIPVWQRYKFVGSQLYVLEFIKASDLKRIHELYPTATLWHNTDFTLDNSDDIDDAYIAPGGANDNFGTAANLRLADGVWDFVIRASNVNDSIGPGATISAAICSLYLYTVEPIARTISHYGMFKVNWVEVDTGSSEGGVTYNDFESPDLEWATEGVLCDNDLGSFNDEDNDACTAARADRRATAEGSQESVTDPGWMGFDFTSWAKTAYDADKAMSLFLTTIGEGFSDGLWFRSRESLPDRPFFTFVYTTAGTETFGETGETETNSLIIATDHTVLSKQTMGATGGTLDSIYVYIHDQGGAPSIKLCIYSAADSSLLAQAAGTVNVEFDTPTYGWQGDAVSVALSANTDYWLGFNAVGDAVNFNVVATTGGVADDCADPLPFLDPFVGGTPYGGQHSIYGVYTPDGADDISYVRRIKEGEGK